MYAAALALLKELGGFATTAQLLTVMTRQQLRVQVQKGGLVRVWYGVYAAADPDLIGRLAALDLFMGQRAVACMGTAAALHGFDLENTCAVHVLDPGASTTTCRAHRLPADRAEQTQKATAEALFVAFCVCSRVGGDRVGRPEF